jgi:hypothetical protein
MESTNVMIDYLKSIELTGVIGIWLYWLPGAFCTVFYIIRTARNYIQDKNNRESSKWYSPTDTIGTLIGRGIVSIVPIANLLAAIFDLAPEVFGKFFKYLDKLFNQPLVPKRKE